MSYIVTGGCGFIGSNFVNYLASTTDKDIIVFDKLTYAGNPANLLSLEMSSNYQFVKMDVNNEEAIFLLFRDHQFDAVVHLAAESHVDRSISNPNEFVYSLEKSRLFAEDARKGARTRFYVPCQESGRQRASRPVK